MDFDKKPYGKMVGTSIETQQINCIAHEEARISVGSNRRRLILDDAPKRKIDMRSGKTARLQKPNL
jgi:hypothetical protein